VAAVYGEQPAKLTTEGLSKLGISGIIGEFTTRGFAADSGMNIRRAAEQINGTIVQPGGTFSLNAVTNPRDAAHGYVEAGSSRTGTRPAASAAASRRSPPRCTTRPTSQA
jgi:vancomycin resistance protein YoaR